MMPVMILCGGMDTRLREETEFLPKPMVEIGGRPMLWHIMKGYAARGFTDFILCLGYKSHKIREYFLHHEVMHCDFTIELGNKDQVDIHGRHNEAGSRVTLVETGLDSQTGARIARALPHVKADQFMLTYGDGVAEVDLNALMRFHEQQEKIATVTGVRPSSRFGEVMASGDRVTAFSEKPRMHEGLINGGFFVLDRKVSEYLSADANCVFEREPMERLAAEGQSAVYRHNGFWQCMDTYRDYQQLQQLWMSGEAGWKTW
jgi:glucose-1-phosphate cytidylyltransferase